MWTSPARAACWSPPGGCGGREAGARARLASLIVSHTVTGAPGREPGTVEVTHLYDAHEQGGALRRTLTMTTLALLTRGEVELAVRHAGFSDVTIYGGYDLAPADDQSPARSSPRASRTPRLGSEGADSGV